MQQRQPRLGDVLDDYCPRERRVTNHAVVAMIGSDVKLTRCTTCEAEHEYKHARVPRQRRKADAPAALYSQVLADAPKRVVHETAGGADEAVEAAPGTDEDQVEPLAASEAEQQPSPAERDVDEDGRDTEGDGPVHRPLIRATLPRPEGQPPPARPAPEFTIRQPGGRQNRFRPPNQRGGQGFFGNRSGGNASGPPMRGGMRPGGGRLGKDARPPHHGRGRKRSK
jgi:hypothetical protein